MNWKRVLLVATVCTVCTMSASQADNRLADVKPTDWAYQGIQTLVKHGAITDTKGLNLNGQVYTRYELTPLVADIVEKREQMNDTDKNIAIRLYSEFRDDLMQYNRDQEIREGKRDESAAANGETPALTKEEIAERMKSFEVDRSRIQTGGDVRIRFGKGGKNDFRTRVGVVIGGSDVAAPDALFDKVGRRAIEEADKEAEKSRAQFAKNRARIEAEEAKEIAEAQKKADKDAEAQKKTDTEVGAQNQSESDKNIAKAVEAEQEANKTAVSGETNTATAIEETKA
ncbi:hypothetical protein [Veillonella intestinalis]|uniref:hypothetical protein n=1 Tax=Veillonella intestinalis TaxID=2941341 RepID=UPI00203F6A0A|nr:hypothetical protein [Veillonella intestinalis]